MADATEQTKGSILTNERAWIQSVRELVRAVCAAGIAELEIQKGLTRVRVRTSAPGRGGVAVGQAEVTLSAPEHEHTVLAPLTGVFYSASSPTSPPYVREGDVVVTGQLVGLIEAMKVFNEVRAEREGRAKRILVGDGTIVQAGAPLIVLEAYAVELDVEALN